MQKYKITLTTQSYTTFGDLNNNTFIDTDITFDDLGLPMIKTRRIKGLLKENAQELLEISDNTDKININSIFGKAGGDKSVMQIDTLTIVDYHKIRNEIEQYNKKNPDNSIYPEFIKKQYTTLIRNTAIYHTKQTAKKTSLRTIRALNQELVFEGIIQINSSLDGEKIKFLKRTIYHTTEGGLNRNSGMGNFILRIEELTNSEGTNNVVSSVADDEDTTNINFKLTYKTIQPIIIPSVNAEKNTISSNNIIPGTVLRGVFAGLYKNTDTGFDAIINEGKVQFGYGFPLDKVGKVNYPHPFFIHKEKDKEKYLNFFFDNIQKDNNNKEQKDKIISKPLRGIGNLIEETTKLSFTKHAVKKEFNFHGTRNSSDEERLAGKNIGGAIYYYEAIAANQTFQFEISGETQCVKIVADTLGKNPIVRFGKSKTAQYGKVELINIEPKEEPQMFFGKECEYIISLQSPCIVFNQYGMPAPSEQTFLAYLQEKIKGIKILKSALSIDTIEIGNALWKSMPLQYNAIAAGSSFLIKGIKNNESELLKNGLGEFTDMGFGKIAIVNNLNIELSKDKVNDCTEKTQPENALIIKFKNHLLNESKYLAGLKEANNSKIELNTTTISSLYEIVKHAKKLEDFLAHLEDENISPTMKEKLKQFGLLEKMKNTKVAKDSSWEAEQANWLAFFKTLKNKTKSTIKQIKDESKN